MKYKVGDKVRVLGDLKATRYSMADGGATDSVVPEMMKYRDKVVTISRITPGGKYNIAEDSGKWSWTDGMFTGLAHKFKVGDRVVASSKAPYGITRNGWRGVVTKVWPNGSINAKGPDMSGKPFTFTALNPKYFDLDKGPGKIIVTTDGKVTTAKLFSGKELVKSAEAKCSPDDTFNFETGAAIAIDRLLDREEKKPVNPFKVGDYVRVTAATYYGHGLAIGSVGRVAVASHVERCEVDGFDTTGERIFQIVHPDDLVKI